jgi:recombination protein RecA
VDLRRIESIKQGTEVMGSRVRARVVKNKVAPPFRVAEFDIMFNRGISREADLVEMGEQVGVVKKSGSFYSFGDTKLGQGKENVKNFLHENPDVAKEIEGQIQGTTDVQLPAELSLNPLSKGNSVPDEGEAS